MITKVRMYTKLHPDTREEEEIHASFLVSAAEYVSKISSKALKSHLNILSYETLRMKNLARQRWLRKNEICQYCHTLWKNGDVSIKILPVSKKETRMKKICRNIAKNKPLVKIEKKLAEARNIKNILLVKCLVCTKEVKFKLRGTYTGMAVGGKKISVPVLSLKNMEKKIKKIMRIEMKMKGQNIPNPQTGVSFDRVSAFPSRGVKKWSSNQTQSPSVGQNISQNGDGDEIEITYESCPPKKKRNLDTTALDHVKPGKKRKKKKSKKTARYGVGVLNTPSSMPYNTPGDPTYNTPFGAECPTPYNMQYNTPYGIPYGMEYSTPYNTGTYAGPYIAACDKSYDEIYADYGDYTLYDYIPPDTAGNAPNKRGKKKKKKKKKGMVMNQSLPINDSGKDLFLNPFSVKVQEMCDLPKKKKKKLNRWKKLISEEESKPTNLPSFKDFLDKL